MTRKRFIKLAMSLGYSRNQAAEMAVEVFRYGSYEFMYLCVLGLPSVIRKVSIGLAVACDAAAAAFSNLGANIRKVFHG